MMKRIIAFMLVMLFMPAALAEWVQPIDCSKYKTGDFAVKEVFTDEEAFCFYGTGYNPGSSVKVSLESEERTMWKTVKISDNGVLSSIKDSISELFTGAYDLFVNDDKSQIKYPNKITVTGEGSDPGDDEDPEDPGDNGTPGEVPEFTAIGAGLALLGAGAIISRRRRD